MDSVNDKTWAESLSNQQILRLRFLLFMRELVQLRMF